MHCGRFRAPVWCATAALAESCHADIIRKVFSERFPDAHDRDTEQAEPPTAQVLNYMAKLREAPEQSDGSSADEGAPERGAGWVGHGPPIEVGVGYVSRELCDGQSLASPGRWSPEQRRYPQDVAVESAVVKLFENFANTYGTEGLLTSLALGKVAECPFPSDEVKNLKAEVVRCAETNGYELRREAADRSDTPIDFRFLQLLLTVAGDPEVHLGGFSLGVRVGPGTLVCPGSQHSTQPRNDGDSRNKVNRETIWSKVNTVSMWRTNYASLDVFSDKVSVEVLEDQASTRPSHQDDGTRGPPTLSRSCGRLTRCPEERQTRGSRISSGAFLMGLTESQ